MSVVGLKIRDYWVGPGGFSNVTASQSLDCIVADLACKVAQSSLLSTEQLKGKADFHFCVTAHQEPLHLHTQIREAETVAHSLL